MCRTTTKIGREERGRSGRRRETRSRRRRGKIEQK